MVLPRSIQLQLQKEQFNGKESYRITAKGDITIFASAKQPIELESSYLEIECTEVINKNAVENNILNTEAMEQLFKTFVKSIENRLFYIKN